MIILKYRNFKKNAICKILHMIRTSKNFISFTFLVGPYNYKSIMFIIKLAAKNGLSALEPVDKTVLTIYYHEIKIWEIKIETT